ILAAFLLDAVVAKARSGLERKTMLLAFKNMAAIAADDGHLVIVATEAIPFPAAEAEQVVRAVKVIALAAREQVLLGAGGTVTRHVAHFAAQGVGQLAGQPGEPALADQRLTVGIAGKVSVAELGF